MNFVFKEWKHIIYLMLIMILFAVLGCDNIKSCKPQYNAKKGYIGFKCDGEF